MDYGLWTMDYGLWSISLDAGNFGRRQGGGGLGRSRHGSVVPQRSPDAAKMLRAGAGHEPRQHHDRGNTLAAAKRRGTRRFPARLDRR